MGLESSLELGDSEGSLALSVLTMEEKENRLYSNIDMNRTQNLPVDMEGETQSGLQEESDESRNDTEERRENKRVSQVS